MNFTSELAKTLWLRYEAKGLVPDASHSGLTARREPLAPIETKLFLFKPIGAILVIRDNIAHAIESDGEDLSILWDTFLDLSMMTERLTKDKIKMTFSADGETIHFKDTSRARALRRALRHR